MWVSPGEVEEGVIKHPAVLEAAVVAEADDKGATIAAAYVALRPGHSAGDALSKEIMEEAARSLPRFKRPQRIHFMEALPRTATGKVQRFKLRQAGVRPIPCRTAAGTWPPHACSSRRRSSLCT